MRRWIHCVVALFFISSPIQAALAEDATPPSPIAKATLSVHAPQVKAGVSIDAGVTFTMPEHWHIYWKNPGDSGLPTTLSWTLPDGIEAGDITWPAPERIEISGLINYGYSNVVTLPVRLTPTRNDVSGEITVEAKWLVCKDICIPESANLSALLKADAQGAELIADAYTKAPKPFAGTATFDVAPDAVTLTLTRDNPWGAFDGVRFSPAEDGIMANNPAVTYKRVGNELTLTAARGAADATREWHGVLHVMRDGKEEAWDVSATNNAPVVSQGGEADSASPPAGEATRLSERSELSRSGEGATSSEHDPHAPSPLASLDPLPQGERVPPASPTSQESSTSPLTTHHSPLTTILLLAFLGGLILNVMPCVLPILALKALAISKKAEASRRAAAMQGISYTAGVIASFLIIAAVMLTLKATGSAIGWGFQLQNPAFVAFLIVVMLLVSANLLGSFELPVLFGEKATSVDDNKLSGSFFTGVLAVLVATPCTAPFMATAIGTTLALPTMQALAVFAALGLGMASPFLLISFWPAARRLLPKPGAWMHRFKQLLAIPMLATVAWLAFVLVQIMSPTPVIKSAGYETYTPARLAELRDAGNPVLVDATAAWCLTCKVNERVALKPAEMQQFLRDRNVTILIADWTKSDPVITEYLASFGRNGVPLVVYYPPHGEPKVLPQVLTPSIVREAIAADAK